ncbi:MAG TPA: glycosyltransferase family 2 protein [Dehalococcoidia bacterium]|jgi:glycosyltransferase involved in cell wall biosynthesis|nr:glycosyltransferase family 2 protein [Dehalococcoidia bacterium]
MAIAHPFDNAQAVAPSQPATGAFTSIVMPCLNEAETVAICVSKALGWLARSGLEGEVVVVDNGSIDGSPELAEAAGARVVHEATRGYGAALRRGFAEAKGDWLVMGDCDDTYDFEALDVLVLPLASGADLVVGNRFAGGIADGAMTWSHRYIGTPAISLLLRIFAGLRVGDSQCGLRAFTRDALNRLELKTDGMELASEMILKAARRGLEVADVPVPYNERIGEAKLNTLRDGWRHLRFLLLSSPHYLFTLPGVVLSLLGILTLGLALPGDTIEIGDRSWQPIFAGGIFFVVGINALLLGLASSAYTTARGITNEDAWNRFYRKHLGLETLIGIGAAFAIAGFALDVLLAVQRPDGMSILGLAAIAQALIIAGCNIVLAGALSTLIED